MELDNPDGFQEKPNAVGTNSVWVFSSLHTNSSLSVSGRCDSTSSLLKQQKDIKEKSVYFHRYRETAGICRTC